MVKRTLPTMTRRQALVGLAVPTITIATGAAAALSDPDGELHALCAASHDYRRACNDATSEDESDLAFERMCEAVKALEAITPTTPAGLAAKIRALAEDDAGSDEKAMRRLVQDAYAVAGLTHSGSLTPMLDHSIEADALHNEQRRQAAERPAVAHERPEIQFRHELASLLRAAPRIPTGDVP